jgi:hypothetical protein
VTASPTHRYHARCHWQGSTAAEYESYDRAHRRASRPPGPGSASGLLHRQQHDLRITVEPTFRVLEYAFGDNEVARRRLALLAEVFNPSSRSLLAEHAPRRARLALDLGCRPGATTRLVAEATRAERTVGLDCPPSFLAAARAERAGETARHTRRHAVSRRRPGRARRRSIGVTAGQPDLPGRRSRRSRCPPVRPQPSPSGGPTPQ